MRHRAQVRRHANSLYGETSEKLQWCPVICASMMLSRKASLCLEQHNAPQLAPHRMTSAWEPRSVSPEWGLQPVSVSTWALPLVMVSSTLRSRGSEGRQRNACKEFGPSDRCAGRCSCRGGAAALGSATGAAGARCIDGGAAGARNLLSQNCSVFAQGQQHSISKVTCS